MLSSILSTVISFIGKVLPFLFAYKSGSDSAKAKQAKETLNVIKKAKESEDDVDRMSPSERDKWL